MKPEVVRSAIADPLTMIASDGILKDGKGHPRAAGTYSRVLGYYVRETRTLTLMDALRQDDFDAGATSGAPCTDDEN